MRGERDACRFAMSKASRHDQSGRRRDLATAAVKPGKCLGNFQPPAGSGINYLEVRRKKPKESPGTGRLKYGI